MEADIAQVVEVLGQFGFSAVFLWLFVREMNGHEVTRENYRKDLREIAGMRAEQFIKDMEGDASSPRPPAGLNKMNGNK